MKAPQKTEPRAPQRITVSLPHRDHDALSALAERCDVSLSWLTRQAVAEFLNKHAQGDLQLPLNLQSKKLAHHG